MAYQFLQSWLKQWLLNCLCIRLKLLTSSIVLMRVEHFYLPKERPGKTWVLMRVFCGFRSAIGLATSVSATKRTSSKLKKKPTCTLPKPLQPPQVEAAPEAHPPHGVGHPSPAGVAVVVAAAPVAATGEAETSEGFSRWQHFITNCFTFLFKWSFKMRSKDSAVVFPLFYMRRWK